MNEIGVNKIEKIFETWCCTLKRKRRRPRSDTEEMSRETEEKMAGYLSEFGPIPKTNSGQRKKEE